MNKFLSKDFLILSGTVDHPQGYLPDILKILDKYNLKSYLDIYNGYFPNKCNWKNIKKQVQGLQTDMWRAGIPTKSELKLYSLIHNDLTVVLIHCIKGECKHGKYPMWKYSFGGYVGCKW